MVWRFLRAASPLALAHQGRGHNVGAPPCGGPAPSALIAPGKEAGQQRRAERRPPTGQGGRQEAAIAE